jgi:hypothetical protein
MHACLRTSVSVRVVPCIHACVQYVLAKRRASTHSFLSAGVLE